jgi:hypothetical protein
MTKPDEPLTTGDCSFDVKMGTSPAAQEAVLVHHAWRKWRDG